MPTTNAITKQESAAWLKAATQDSTGQITAMGTEITFDFVQDSGPEWPAPEGAAAADEIQATAADGTIVAYAKTQQTVDGATGTVRSSGTTSSGGHKLKFTILEWGKTLAGSIPQLLGQVVLCCIPIGRNITSGERGFYYLLGKVSGAISYTAKGDEVVSVAIEVTGTVCTASTAGDTAIIAALTAITPVGSTTPLTPTALVSGDLTTLKKGQIVVK